MNGSRLGAADILVFVRSYEGRRGQAPLQEECGQRPGAAVAAEHAIETVTNDQAGEPACARSHAAEDAMTSYLFSCDFEEHERTVARDAEAASAAS
jgi:hypothetical protein